MHKTSSIYHNLSYILSLIIVYSCVSVESTNAKHRIVGNWAYISTSQPDSTNIYVEMTLYDNKISNYDNLIGPTSSCNYDIQQDSIYIYYTDTSAFKAKVTVINDTLMRWTNENESYDIYRITSAEYTLLDRDVLLQTLCSSIKDNRHLQNSIRHTVDDYYTRWFVRREILHYYRTKRISFDEAVEWMNTLSKNKYSSQWERGNAPDVLLLSQ